MNRLTIYFLVLILGGCTMIKKPEQQTEPLPDFDRLWDYNDPKATEMKFRNLVPQAKASGDISYHAQLLTQIARSQGLQGNFEEAHRTLETADFLASDKFPVARIRYLLERGRVYNSSGDPDRSKPFFLEAWELAVEKGEDYYAIDAAHMMGIVEPPEKQLAWAEKAIAIIEKTEDPRAKKWMGPLYNNTGWTYHDLGQYERALELFQRSLEWREENNDEIGARVARWTIGRCYRSLGRIEEALQIQKQLEAEIEEKNLDPDGYVIEEIGECLLVLNKPDEAAPYFKRAYELLSKDHWLMSNEPDRLERLKQLGGD